MMNWVHRSHLRGSHRNISNQNSQVPGGASQLVKPDLPKADATTKDIASMSGWGHDDDEDFGDCPPPPSSSEEENREGEGFF